MTSPRDKSITATNTAPGSALASAATTSMTTTSALRIIASATTCTHRTAITRTTTTRLVAIPRQRSMKSTRLSTRTVPRIHTVASGRTRVSIQCRLPTRPRLRIILQPRLAAAPVVILHLLMVPAGPPLAALLLPTLLEVEDPHPAALLLVILLLEALPEALPLPALLEVEDPHPAALLPVILLLEALPPEALLLVALLEGPLEDLLLVDLLEVLLEDLPAALLEVLLEVLLPAALHLVDPLEALFQEAPLLAALLRAGAQEAVEVCLPAYPETWSRIIEREKRDGIWMGNAGAVARKMAPAHIGFSRLCSGIKGDEQC